MRDWDGTLLPARVEARDNPGADFAPERQAYKQLVFVNSGDWVNCSSGTEFVARGSRSLAGVGSTSIGRPTSKLSLLMLRIPSDIMMTETLLDSARRLSP